MKWDDVGFLLSKNRYNENSLITKFLPKIMEKFQCRLEDKKI